MASGRDGDHDALKHLLLDPKLGRRPLVYGPAKLGIIWSPKSACTSVLLWYLWHCDWLEEARAYDSWPHNYRTRVLYDKPLYRAWVDQVGEGAWTWLRVVRDPFKRAVSSYRHALRYGYENAAMTRVLGYPIHHARGFSFDLFLDYLLRIDITACNTHHSEQRNPIESLIVPTEVINVDKTDLMSRLHILDARLGTPRVPVEALSQLIEGIALYHRALPKAVDGGQASKTFTAEDALGLWPPHEAFLDDSTRAKIAAIYASDLAAYADHW